jgi:hypothetical protein
VIETPGVEVFEKYTAMNDGEINGLIANRRRQIAIPPYTDVAGIALHLMTTREWPWFWLLGKYDAEDGSVMWNIVGQDDDGEHETVAYDVSPARVIAVAWLMATDKGVGSG